MKSTRKYAFYKTMSRLYTNTINHLICFFTEHELIHTDENRDNALRHKVLATDRCTRCSYRKVYYD